MRARVYSACTVQVRREFDTNTRGEFVTNTVEPFREFAEVGGFGAEDLPPMLV